MGSLESVVIWAQGFVNLKSCCKSAIKRQRRELCPVQYMREMDASYGTSVQPASIGTCDLLLLPVYLDVHIYLMYFTFDLVPKTGFFPDLMIVCRFSEGTVNKFAVLIRNFWVKRHTFVTSKSSYIFLYMDLRVDTWDLLFQAEAPDSYASCEFFATISRLVIHALSKQFTLTYGNGGFPQVYAYFVLQYPCTMYPRNLTHSSSTLHLEILRSNSRSYMPFYSPFLVSTYTLKSKKASNIVHVSAARESTTT